MKTVDIVIPVYNEEKVLSDSVSTLRDYLLEHVTCGWKICIADNASTDSTLQIATGLSEQYDDVSYIHLDEKGRGRALRRAWLASDADIVSYMDVDLSTDLHAFPQLVVSIEEGYDVVIGSRLLPESHVVRSLKRELLSRGYNFLIRMLFGISFHDAQCGFKALRHDAAQQLIPEIEDQEWFFDTELLLLAHRNGYRIKELPVGWVEAESTTVNVVNTMVKDIKGLLRMRFGTRHQISR